MKFEHKIIKINLLIEVFYGCIKKYRIYKYFRQTNLF